MIIKFSENEWFTAGDQTTLKEVLDPLKLHLHLPFSMAFAFLEKGEISLLHTLNTTEVYFITNGNGEILIDDNRSEIAKGDVIIVQPLCKQSLKNIGNTRLEFVCIVSPPWTKEGEQIL